MNGAEHLAEIRRWLRYAHDDLRAAEAFAASEEAQPRHVCFLAQQAAEKTLKAALVFLQVEFPFTHDLDDLRECLPDGWLLKAEHPDLASLTVWAVGARYPGDWPEARDSDADDAVRQSRAVWESALRDLERFGFAGEARP